MYNSIEQIKVFYPLQTWEDNKILRKKSEKVDIFDDEIKEFSEILLDLMYAYDWVGLAAPQVGKNIRIIATTQWKETKKWRKNTREINFRTFRRKEKMRRSLSFCAWTMWRCREMDSNCTKISG